MADKLHPLAPPGSRPPQPSKFIRLIVAYRQYFAMSCRNAKITANIAKNEGAIGSELERVLGHLAARFGCDRHDLRLDHDPQLAMREYDDDRRKNLTEAERYTPHAHDPEYLIYRSAHGHHIKSNVSGDGAQRSDTAARVHERRLESNRSRRDATRAGEPKNHRAIAANQARPNRIKSGKHWPPRGSRKIPRRVK